MTGTADTDRRVNRGWPLRTVWPPCIGHTGGWRPALVSGGTRLWFRPTFLLRTRPAGDSDLSNRWRPIKIRFARTIAATERRSAVAAGRGERGIWQRRFWEHTIRKQTDDARPVDYVHVSPMKHGHVQWMADLPYSSFHPLDHGEVYPPDWCGDGVEQLDAGERE